MPNYVTNIIKMEGNKKRFKKVLNYLEGDESKIDFNKIIPMPESLNVNAGTSETYAIAVYLYKERNDDSKLKEILNYSWAKSEKIKTVNDLYEYLLIRHKNLLEDGKIYVDNIEKYGSSTWYDWCIKNWGTKWNAGDAWVNEDSFGFCTAWANVINLICKLSKRFNDITFNYDFADEDFGFNLGRVKIKNGEVIEGYFPEGGSDEACDLAAEILGYDYRED